MTPSLEGWPTKAKEAPFPHEVKSTRCFESIRYTDEIEKLVESLYASLYESNLYSFKEYDV